jgi:hypothetical protein
MENLDLILYIIAAILFALAAFFSSDTRISRFNLVAAGLFFWVLTNITT